MLRQGSIPIPKQSGQEPAHPKPALPRSRRWRRRQGRAAGLGATNAAIAGIVGVHELTVRHWIKTRELTASTFGTRIGYRIRRSDVATFLNQRTLAGAIAAQLLRGASTAADS